MQNRGALVSAVIAGLDTEVGCSRLRRVKMAKVGNIRLWCNPSLSQEFWCEEDGPPELGCSRVLALQMDANRKHPICGGQARGWRCGAGKGAL